MPRERNPLRDRAKELWDASDQSRGVLKGIAAELGVPESRIRKWKSEDGWDAPANRNAPKKKKGSAPNPSKRNAPKKQRQRGGQPGNKNAVGSPGPVGYQNHRIHGLYETIYWDMLSPEEHDLIQSMNFDNAEIYLMDEIGLLTVRERRLMVSINRLRDAKAGLTLDSVTKREMEIKGNVVKGHEQKQTETTTKTTSTLDAIAKLESELTRVQKAKARFLEALEKLRLQRKQSEEGSGGQAVDDWIASVMDDEGGDPDE